MTETLQAGSAIALLGLSLVTYRAGLPYSVRVVGNFWYALAHGIVAFRREFERLNTEARSL